MAIFKNTSVTGSLSIEKTQIFQLPTQPNLQLSGSIWYDERRNRVVFTYVSASVIRSGSIVSGNTL
jgi:hypothetical protein